MVSEISPLRQIKLRDYRYPGEVLSLVLTFLILVALYALVIFLFLRNAAQIGQTLLITVLGIAAYIITVLVQQKSAFGTLVRVSPRQFSEIYDAGITASTRLSMTAVPIYVKRSSEQNIYTLGLLGQPLIVITSAMIDQMSLESLQFFIGRELGHIRAGHTWLRTLLRPLGTGVPVIGKLLDSVIFGDWMNRTEYTADRAGFLACDSLTTAISTMLKFSVGTSLFQKLDIREFLEQINDIRNVRGRVTEIVAEQPYLIQRIRRLARFALSKKVSALAARDRKDTGILEQLPHAFIDTTNPHASEYKAVQPDTHTASNLGAAPPQDNAFDPHLTLVAVNGGLKYELRKLRTRIGRGIDNDIVLNNDERVSRNHAEIIWQDNKMVLVDCESRNGVWLNQQKIQQSAVLNTNDHIRFGRHEFIFVAKI